MDPEKQKQIDDAIALLRGEKYVVRTTDDEKTYLTNHTSDVVNAKAKEMFTTFHKSVEKASGIGLGNNEKATEYVTRAFKEKDELLTTASTALKEFQDGQVSKDDTLKQLNTQLKGVKDELKSAKTELEGEKANYKKERFDNMLTARIDATVDSLRGQFKKFDDDRVLENNIKAEVLNFKNKYTPKELDGEIVYYEGEKPALDTDTGNMLGTAQLLTEQLKFLIAEKQERKGTGAPGSGGAGGGNKDDLVIPATVKSKSQLIEHLVGVLKMDSNSDKFLEAYGKYGKELPLDVANTV